MADKEKFKNLIIMKPMIKRFIKDEIKSLKNKDNNNNENITNKEINAKEDDELEKEFKKKISNFSKIKNEKLSSAKNFKKFIVLTINNFSDLDRSIFLTILFRKDLKNVSWKTFNISKSTFYRRLKFIEKFIKWCLFD
ncbi:hypothetical protein [Metamycoplasma alkalescens]|uniref:hypothetical protein n=1 Tax=Metamycoplasma alkalescens TaxID=45363 RepID=UPI0003A36538|nr:hypothetical protein [Metamycoplasma alkalescens]